ncbi:MAG TPA: BrxA family protein, partial [Ktedonobacterales bacterium]|nr:BrxA family protein [Ktedonobacterales bacterium]
IPEMLETFRQRYLTDPQMLHALVTLAREGAADTVVDPILYLLATRDDPLLRDVVLDLLAPMLARGQTAVRPDDVARWLTAQAAAGRAQRPWSDATIQRLARGLLATLRDFSILRGKATKKLEPFFLAVPAFAFLALLLSRDRPSGDKLLHDASWRLFFLEQPAVEHLFFEAHQERLLTYQAAGRVIRVEFPTRSLEEYAHVVARRPL